jgi:hypothetical protein
MLGDRQREGENTEFVEQDGEKREWMHKASIREKGQMLVTNRSTRRQTADIQSGFAMYTPMNKEQRNWFSPVAILCILNIY